MVVRAGAADLIVEIDDSLKLRVDLDGRWLSLRDATGLYRRLVDGRVVKAVRPVCDVVDPNVVHERVRQVARQMSERLAAPAAPVAAGQRQLARQWLDRVQAWDGGRFAALEREFRATYAEPVAILPPDRSLDIVVLPAFGCPWAKCSFCAFYQGQTYRVLSEDDFASHLRAVKNLFGSTESLRHGIFLGSANALALSDRRLHRVFTQVREEFGERPRGVAAFWDPDHAPERGSDAWEELATVGLRVVYAGLETGCSELRQRLGKHGDVESFMNCVRTCRRAGIRIGITVLAGISADEPWLLAKRDEATARAIASMDLGRDDIVFVSSVAETERRQARQDARLLMAKLSQITAARLAPYAMDTFRYYA